MTKTISKILTVAACFTLLMNAILPVLLWFTYRSNTTRDLSDPYVHESHAFYMGFEFATFASKDTGMIFMAAVWTTFLAFGYLNRDRFFTERFAS